WHPSFTLQLWCRAHSLFWLRGGHECSAFSSATSAVLHSFDEHRLRMPAFLTRRVTFAAAHRYRVPEWSNERNEQVFGLCSRPSYHGHSYVCDVTVRGEIDAVTGFAVDL